MNHARKRCLPANATSSWMTRLTCSTRTGRRPYSGPTPTRCGRSSTRFSPKRGRPRRCLGAHIRPGSIKPSSRRWRTGCLTMRPPNCALSSRRNWRGWPERPRAPEAGRHILPLHDRATPCPGAIAWRTFLMRQCGGARQLSREPGIRYSVAGSRPAITTIRINEALAAGSAGEAWFMNKVYADAPAALAGLLRDGMLIMAGGFGLCGLPEALIMAIRESGVSNLTVVSNNAGVDGVGLGILIESRQIKKMISSYVGENKLFAQQYLAGELEIEFNPQGTLAERIRAGGAGIPAFFTRTGAGTDIARGKEERVFNGETYIMETGLVADLAIVHAFKGDTEGNLVYRKTARNFNPVMATAARLTVAEVEHLVEPGEIDPDHIITPGIFVKRIIHVPNAVKHIEQRTVRKRT